MHGGTNENHKDNNEDSRSPDISLNPGPPEYQTGALTTRVRRSVTISQGPPLRCTKRDIHKFTFITINGSLMTKLIYPVTTYHSLNLIHIKKQNVLTQT
jgi:hypothetical protein